MAVLAGDVEVVRAVLRFSLEPEGGDGVSFEKDGVVNVRKSSQRKPLFRPADKDDSGVSAFMLAVMLGEVRIVGEMGEFDADAFNLTFYSLTALHVAAGVGSVAMVTYLVDRLRCPVDSKDQNRATPIFYACGAGHEEVVEFLCSRGAFVDVEDGQSQSPIMMALEAGHVSLARVLLRYKADVNAFNLHGDNAIWLCITRNLPDLLAEFVAGGTCDLNAGLERHRNTLLHKLILFIDNEQLGCLMVASLLSHGARVDSLNYERKTPLFHAAALCKGKMVTLLLNSGANARHTDCFDNTPLHFAFDPAVAAALVEKGAKVNVANIDGNTPMHVMAAFGFDETVSFLRSVGGKDGAKNKNGNAPRDVFSPVVRSGWFVCLPFFSDDEASVATGGIVILDRPRTEGASTSVSQVKTKARNSFRNVARKIKGAAEKLNDSLSDMSSDQK